MSKFETKAKRELREKVEEQGLYLLQLWADTFMMHQDHYPGFQKYYRELKVEGIKFPERDLNERTMMDNLQGISSPMFDFIEQSNKNQKVDTDLKQRKSNLSDKNTTSEKQEDQPVTELSENKEEEIKKQEDRIKELEDMEDYVEQRPKSAERIENDDYSKYKRTIFDRSEFDVARSNADILDNMAVNCENFTDI